MFIRKLSIVLLIFIISISNIFAETNKEEEKNVYEGAQYIRNEEEAKAAYTLALYYKERALASKTVTQETIKDLESAKVIFLEVLKYVQNKDIYISLAETYEALGEYYQSSKIYDNLVFDDPEDIEILVKAAERNIFVINNISKARYYLETAYELDQTYSDTLILLGFTYYQQKDFEKAIYYFSKVNPNNKASNNYMEYYNFYYGMSEFYLSRFENTINRLKKLQNVQLSPVDSYSAAYGIVKSYQALEKYNEAYSNSLLIDDATYLSAYLSFMANEYNEELSKSLSNAYLIHKIGEIPYGGGTGNKIELCDVMTQDNKLIHIKKNGGSAYLSHLFNQAAVSAELLLDNTFRNKVNDKMNEFKFNKNFPIDFKPTNYTIIIGIINKYHDARPKIPFFSKVSLQYTINSMKKWGYNVQLKNINKI